MTAGTAGEVREACKQGLCEACPGNYDIRVAGSPAPAVSGRCGHHCHGPRRVTVTTLGAGR